MVAKVVLPISAPSSSQGDRVAAETAIARTLSRNMRMMGLDEPAASLDFGKQCRCSI